MTEQLLVSKELLEQVVEWDELKNGMSSLYRLQKELRTALEQPAVEPDDEPSGVVMGFTEDGKAIVDHDGYFEGQALYTAPQPQQPAVDEQLMRLLASAWFYGGWKAETKNERDMEAIMVKAGWWPFKDEDALLAKIASAPQSQQPAVEHVSEPYSELVEYVLQDDIHNRLTPRVVDIAYSAFMIAKSGKNKDDGGSCDWFNDTKPMVMEQLFKIKRDLAAAPQPQQPLTLSDEEIVDCWNKVGLLSANLKNVFARAIEAAVWQKLGVRE